MSHLNSTYSYKTRHAGHTGEVKGKGARLARLAFGTPIADKEMLNNASCLQGCSYKSHHYKYSEQHYMGLHAMHQFCIISIGNVYSTSTFI